MLCVTDSGVPVLMVFMCCVLQIVEYLHHTTRGEALDVVDSLLGETGENVCVYVCVRVCVCVCECVCVCVCVCVCECV